MISDQITKDQSNARKLYGTRTVETRKWLFVQGTRVIEWTSETCSPQQGPIEAAAAVFCAHRGFLGCALFAGLTKCSKMCKGAKIQTSKLGSDFGIQLKLASADCLRLSFAQISRFYFYFRFRDQRA